MKRLFAASFAVHGVLALAATLGVTTDAVAATGDPTGTTYGFSAKNYGGPSGPGSFGDVGTDLLFSTDASYVELSDWTQDEQLGPGGGAPVMLTFDGIAESVNGLLVNESYQVWDPDTYGVPEGHNVAILGGVYDENNPLPVAQWDKPAHLIEFSMKDTAGSLLEGGGLNRDIFKAALVRLDGVTPDSVTPGGGLATPLFPGDRHPEQIPPPLFTGQSSGFYFYFKRNGAASNPSAPIALPTDVLQGDHPTLGAAQQVYYIVYSQNGADEDITHDIGPGTLSFNSDTGRELGDFDPNANLVTLGSFLSIDIENDIDELVFGQIYTMIADGDGNNDGKVDGLDYLRWASNFGLLPANVPLEEQDGSFDPIEAAPSSDGTRAGNDGALDFRRYYGDYERDAVLSPVDGLDYLKWAANFGFVGDGSDTLGTAVPEPGTFALAGLALVGLLATRRRRLMVNW